MAETELKYSGIGGQAVMEGIMMRNGEKYAIAVRKPDKDIALEVRPCGSRNGLVWTRIPIVRGVVNFVDSLVSGISCLMFSASFFIEDEDDDKKKKEAKKNLSAEELKAVEAKEKKQENLLMAGTLILAIGLAVLLFMVLPYFLSSLLGNVIKDTFLLTLIESLIRVAVFIIYLWWISRLKDIQRTFMYHGAEHKCINCVEHGMELNVENVMKSSRMHKRCGTSFLFYVIIISVIVLMLIQVESHSMRIVVRLVTIPLIAGIAYEFIRLAGRSDNAFVRAVSKPGMALQKLTTREPTEDMAEVAITAVEAVFDWRQFLRDNYGLDIPDPVETDEDTTENEADAAEMKADITESEADAADMEADITESEADAAVAEDDTAECANSGTETEDPESTNDEPETDKPEGMNDEPETDKPEGMNDEPETEQ